MSWGGNIMEVFDKFLLNLYHIIKEYPIYYFGIISLFFVLMLYSLLKEKYNKGFTIKKIKFLLRKKPEKALQKLIKSDLDIIDYFLNKDNLNSSEYIKVKEYLLKVDQVKAIYNKIINLDDNDEQVITGISILSRLPVPQAADYLITFLYKDDPEIVNLAIKALSNNTTEKVLYSLIEFLRYIPDSKILLSLKETFKNMGVKAAKKLIPFIYEADSTTIIWYLDILGEYQIEELHQILLNLLDSDDPEIKIHVIQKLSKYELEDDELNRIITLVDDENQKVRSRAIKTLGNIKILKAAPHIAKRLTDDSGIVRIAATQALLNMGYEGIKYIFEVAKRPDAPKEITKTLKDQDIAFLIEALEHVYKGDQKQIQTINTKLTS